VVVLTATIFSLLGFINAVFARNFDDISIIPTFVLTPLTYLGGVFYSIYVAAAVLADGVDGQPGAAHGQCLPLRHSGGVGHQNQRGLDLYGRGDRGVVRLGCARLLVSGRGMRQ
jgi:ABC-2 type transport system permease protein